MPAGTNKGVEKHFGGWDKKFFRAFLNFDNWFGWGGFFRGRFFFWGIFSFAPPQRGGQSNLGARYGAGPPGAWVFSFSNSFLHFLSFWGVGIGRPISQTKSWRGGRQGEFVFLWGGGKREGGGDGFKFLFLWPKKGPKKTFLRRGGPDKKKKPTPPQKPQFFFRRSRRGARRKGLKKSEPKVFQIFGALGPLLGSAARVGG